MNAVERPLPEREGTSDAVDVGRRRVLTKLALAGGTAWAAPIVLSSPAVALGTPCTTGSNLVVNGDASQGLTGWTAVLSGGVSAVGGFFVAGNANSTYVSEQIVELGSDCGIGTTSAALEADLRGSHNGIASQIEVIWYDAAAGTGTSLGTLVISRTATSFALVSTSGTVPAATLSARVRMSLHGHPTQTRGAADNISLILT